MDPTLQTYWYLAGTPYTLAWAPTDPLPYDAGDWVSLQVFRDQKAEGQFLIGLDNLAQLSHREALEALGPDPFTKAIRLYTALWVEPRLWNSSRHPTKKRLHIVSSKELTQLLEPRSRAEEEEAIMRLSLGHFLTHDRGNGTSFDATQVQYFFPSWMDLDRLPSVLSLLSARSFLAPGPDLALDAEHAVALQKELAWRDEKNEAGSPAENLTQPTNKRSLASQSTAFRLSTLEINNLRIFDRLRFLPPPKRQNRTWSIILGDNGLGKTTILRALALAFVDRQIAGTVLSLLPSSLIAQGSDYATIHARIDEFKDADQATKTSGFILSELTLDKQGEQTLLSNFKQLNTEADPPLVFAYGCRRGSALGGPKRDVDLSLLGGIRTLFDETANLIHAETWLEERYAASLEKPNSKDSRFFDSIIQVLQNILPRVQRLKVRPGQGVFVHFAEQKTEVPLNAMSDGYLTTVGWIVDLIARWAHHANMAGLELDQNFHKSMVGLVLVDEIDLHLHPKWQRTVIQDLKRCFPRLTFVATTHNPLTLLGAEDGEIYILEESSEKTRVTLQQRDLPPGLRTDQILTGAWFGLASTLDDDTLSLLETHRELLLQGVPEDDEKRLHLEQTLRERLGGFADTPLEKLALLAVAQELQQSEPYETQSSEEKAKAQERIKRLFAKKLQEKRQKKE